MAVTALQLSLCGTHLPADRGLRPSDRVHSPDRSGWEGKRPTSFPHAHGCPHAVRPENHQHAASSTEVNGMTAFLLPGVHPASRLWNGITPAIARMPCPLGSSRSHQSLLRGHIMSTPTGTRERWSATKAAPPRPGVVVHSCHPSPQEAEAGGLCIHCHQTLGVETSALAPTAVRSGDRGLPSERTPPYVCVTGSLMFDVPVTWDVFSSAWRKDWNRLHPPPK